MLREECPIRLAVDVTVGMNKDLFDYKTEKGITHTSDALRMILKEKFDIGRD